MDHVLKSLTKSKNLVFTMFNDTCRRPDIDSLDNKEELNSDYQTYW